MLFTNDVHIHFQYMHMHAYYIHALCYIHTVDIYMTAVCINVYTIMFNVYIKALACFDGYARVATLITDTFCSDY